MSDEKKKDDVVNKGFTPNSNKTVRIRFLPNRRIEGVVVDNDGYAVVDQKTAEYALKIKYAVMAEEK